MHNDKKKHNDNAKQITFKEIARTVENQIWILTGIAHHTIHWSKTGMTAADLVLRRVSF